MALANNVDSRADYIRELTSSLSLSGNIPPIHRDRRPVTGSVFDEGTKGEDSSTAAESYLYKYGKEVSTAGGSSLSSTSLMPSLSAPARSGPTAGNQLTSSFPALGTTGQGQPVSFLDSFSQDTGDFKSESLDRDTASVGGSIADESTVVFLSNKERGRPHKLVSGSQFRLTTKAGAYHHCQQCDILDRVNKKSKETIRSLKLQLARLEERCHDLKRTKASDVAHQIAIKSSLELAQSDNEDLSYYSQRCDTLEEEMAKLKKILAYERTANDGLRKTLEDVKSNLKQELHDKQEENANLRQDLERNQIETADAKKRVEELNVTLTHYRQQLEKTEARLSDSLLRLNASKTHNFDIDQLREIQRLKALLQEQESAQKALNSTLRQKDTELGNLDERMKVLQLSVNGIEEQRDALQIQLNRSQAEFRSSQEMLQATKKRCDVLEGTVKSTVEQRVNVSKQLNECQNDLRAAKHQIKTQTGEIESLNIRVSELLRKNAVDAETHRQALEKAVSSSVRLCVVAPTVNVQVADNKKLRFKSEVSSENLSQFLKNEVLQKYSFLFKQKSDNSAPDGDSLEDWLQQMLAQMQKSIEQHVNSAMNGSSI